VPSVCSMSPTIAAPRADFPEPIDPTTMVSEPTGRESEMCERASLLVGGVEGAGVGGRRKEVEEEEDSEEDDD
jgi:hypothetical protein